MSVHILQVCVLISLLVLPFACQECPVVKACESDTQGQVGKGVSGIGLGAPDSRNNLNGRGMEFINEPVVLQ